MSIHYHYVTRQSIIGPCPFQEFIIIIVCGCHPACGTYCAPGLSTSEVRSPNAQDVPSADRQLQRLLINYFLLKEFIRKVCGCPSIYLWNVLCTGAIDQGLPPLFWLSTLEVNSPDAQDVPWTDRQWQSFLINSCRYILNQYTKLRKLSANCCLFCFKASFVLLETKSSLSLYLLSVSSPDLQEKKLQFSPKMPPLRIFSHLASQMVIFGRKQCPARNSTHIAAT